MGFKQNASFPPRKSFRKSNHGFKHSSFVPLSLDEIYYSFFIAYECAQVPSYARENVNETHFCLQQLSN